ncbi:LamG-like jellyroll fold domain-containing protein [Nitrosospira sp. Is2]|uniref:LamG-like jellyroll fold domain-containing protein n=1 Tax=Nitrosospira sp. Is2 TaxID=3080532 RepID=UPI0029557BC4|nr:LamG-like jellyroll fold domain-containing protein [Nitrosospira sp. Is2]WON73734.1 LamG-like jellyroll fold domain-containing protein [Nitrosospira sp. Is2]
MALSLSQRFLKQPQHAAPLDPNHPLFKDIVFAYSAGRGLLDGKHPGKSGSFAGTMLYGYGANGKHVRTGAANSHLAFPNIDDYNVLGEVTAVALIRQASATSQGSIVHKAETSGGTNTPFGLLVESTGAISFNRSNAGGSTPFRVWASAATLAVNQLAVIAATQGGEISVPPKFFIDGGFDSGTPTGLYGGTGTGAPTPTSVSLKLGNRTDNFSRFSGEIYDVIILKRVLSASEIADLSRNVWAIWQAPSRRLWVIAAETNLTGTAFGQSNSAGLGNIAQVHGLRAPASTQANPSGADAITLSMVIDLARAEIIHGNSAGTAGVTQNHFLPAVPIAAPVQHAIWATEAVTQKHVAAAASAKQENESSGGKIARGIGNFVPQPAIQQNADGAGSVSQTHILSGIATFAQHGIRVAEAITQNHIAAGASATQENESSTGKIARGIGNFVPQPAIQQNANGAGSVSQTHILSGTAASQLNNAADASLGGERIIETELLTRIASAPVASVKKPGIPVGTPMWLKTTMEILTGRRGNRVEVPKFQELTFSAVPTKGECEALYRYINAVRHSLEQIIKRLDS